MRQVSSAVPLVAALVEVRISQSEARVYAPGGQNGRQALAGWPVHLAFFTELILLTCKLVLKRAYTAYARGKLQLTGGSTRTKNYSLFQFFICEKQNIGKFLFALYWFRNLLCINQHSRFIFVTLQSILFRLQYRRRRRSNKSCNSNPPNILQFRRMME